MNSISSLALGSPLQGGGGERGRGLFLLILLLLPLSLMAQTEVTIDEGLYRIHNNTMYGDEYLYESCGLLNSSDADKGDVWQIRVCGACYTIRNVRTGHYIQETTGGECAYGLSQLTLAAKPVVFHFFTDWESTGYYLRTTRMMIDGLCINAAGWGTPVGTYQYCKAGTSEWIFVPETAE